MIDTDTEVRENTKDILQLTTSVKNLMYVVENMAETHSSFTSNMNNKIDILVTAMNDNMLLEQKVNTLANNIKESFDRVHGEMRRVNDIHDNEGCGTLKTMTEKMSVANNRIRDLEANFNGEKKSLTELGKELTTKGEGRLKTGLMITFSVFSPLMLGAYYYSFSIDGKLLTMFKDINKVKVELAKEQGIHYKDKGH